MPFSSKSWENKISAVRIAENNEAEKYRKYRIYTQNYNRMIGVDSYNFDVKGLYNNKT